MKQIDILIERYSNLAVCKESLETAAEILINSYKAGNKLLVAGNGGSASDSDHITGELMKGFEKKRTISNELFESLKSINEEDALHLKSVLQCGLPTIPLTEHAGLMTAFANDSSADAVFANQVLGYGKKGDVFFAISTSGNSKNIVLACEVAKALGLKIIGLTGERDSKISELADVTIKVPSTRTYQIQEYHLPIYHALCLEIEDYFFEE
ncbi:MAG: SIS domain-containing protein [Acholeplasmatales bacterium]|nr:SIS domain-containing protein [Acholeplasmatales bacterium]